MDVPPVFAQSQLQRVCIVQVLSAKERSAPAGTTKANWVLMGMGRGSVGQGLRCRVTKVSVLPSS